MKWLTAQIWNGCHDLEDMLPCFKGISSDITKTPVNCSLGRLEINVNPKESDNYLEDIPKTLDNEDESPTKFGKWNERLTDAQKLCMIKCFAEDKVSVYHCHLKLA